jgi:hypothetical protein
MGMGGCAAAIVSLCSVIPLFGGPMIALLSPVALASFYLAIDRASRLGAMRMPRSLRLIALQHSPRELFSVFADERRLLPTLTVSILCLLVAVLTNTLIYVIAGRAWATAWTSLGPAGFLSVLVAAFVSVCIFFLLALAVVYSLPRTFLQGEPLIPEMRRSFRVGMRFPAAMAATLGALLIPPLMASAASMNSPWLGFFVGLLLYTLVLPWVACSLYCSYRAIFTVKR